MTGSGAVAPLAAHVDFREGRRVAVVCRVIILAQAGRMALCAHEIPILIQLRPVQHIVMADLLVGIEMKPALAALLLRTTVPHNRQRLNASIGKLDQVLLQRIDPESVFHLERGRVAVGAVSLDQELPILAKETRTHAVIVEARVVKIAKHRLVSRVIHRLLVVRCAPQLRLRLMAPGAGVAADERCSGSAGPVAGQRNFIQQIEPKPDDGGDHSHD
jgi:hypothetical protein